MIVNFDGKNTIMCQNASQIMIDSIFIRSYQMQSFWQKIHKCFYIKREIEIEDIST